MPETTDERLDEIAGPLDEAARGIRDRVRKMMCPCLAAKECLWPDCANLGDGIGHYP